MGNCAHRGPLEKPTSEVSGHEAVFLEALEPLDFAEIAATPADKLKERLAAVERAYNEYAFRFSVSLEQRFSHNMYSLEILQLTALDGLCFTGTGQLVVKVELLPSGPQFETSAVDRDAPVWNRFFQFLSPSLFETVNIQVRSKAALLSDRLLGTVQFTQKELADQRLHQGWFPVCTLNDVQVELFLKIQLITDEKELLNELMEEAQSIRGVLQSKLEEGS